MQPEGGGPRRRKKWLLAGAVILIAVLAAVAAGGVWLARGAENEIPPNVIIGGVNVSGMSLDEARFALRSVQDEVATEQIVLTFSNSLEETESVALPAAERTITVSGRELGVSADIESAILTAAESRGAVSRLFARLGFNDPIEIPLEFSPDEKRVAAFVDRVEETVTKAPVSARLALDNGEIVHERARFGRALDAEALTAELMTLPSSVEIALTTLEPPISDDATEAAKRIATELLEDPPEIVFQKTTYKLPRNLMRDALRIESTGQSYEVSVRPKVLVDPLKRAFAKFEREPTDAGFRVDGPKAFVVPSKEGRRVAVNRTVARLVEKADAEKVKVRFAPWVPDLTTEEAKDMGIKVVVSSFTTPYSCCPPRVTNIQRAAQILDGQIIPAGEKFSLNEALGKRTRDRGFVGAPQIAAGGRLEDAVGGGVSQVATTMYNAAFFAGLELIQSTPHSFYISRYPMGREATVSWGGPELIFRNDWPAAILIKAYAGSNAITIEFYSSKLGRRVDTTTSEPYNYTSPTTKTISNPSLPAGSRVVVQGGGISGFSVDYTRKVFQGETVRRNEKYTVRYQPEHTFVEVGPPAPKQPKEKKKTAADEGIPALEDGTGGAPAEEPPAEEAPPPAEDSEQ